MRLQVCRVRGYSQTYLQADKLDRISRGHANGMRNRKTKHCVYVCMRACVFMIESGGK